MLLHQSKYDALAVSWYHKRIFDHVRPYTSIPIAFGEGVDDSDSEGDQGGDENRRRDRPSDPELVSSWGGPGVGTVLMRPRDFRSYARSDAHPEHPSGTP